MIRNIKRMLGAGVGFVLVLIVWMGGCASTHPQHHSGLSEPYGHTESAAECVSSDVSGVDPEHAPAEHHLHNGEHGLPTHHDHEGHIVGHSHHGPEGTGSTVAAAPHHRAAASHHSIHGGRDHPNALPHTGSHVDKPVNPSGIIGSAAHKVPEHHLHAVARLVHEAELRLAAAAEHLHHVHTAAAEYGQVPNTPAPHTEETQ